MAKIYEDLSAKVLGANGFEDFKAYITANPNLLTKQFWTAKGSRTVLTWLVENHSQDVDLVPHIEWLLNQPGVNPNKMFPVHFALSKGKFDLLDALLEPNNLNIDALNTRGESILLLALSSGNEEVIEKVLAKNPDVSLLATVYQNETKPMEFYPLLWAVIKGLSVPILSLLQKGADINMTLTDKAFGPLHFAAFYSKANSLKVLLENRSAYSFDLDEKGNDGKTAIHLLCDGIKNGRNLDDSLQCLAYLISHGARIPAGTNYQEILIKYSSQLMTLSTVYLKHNPNLAPVFYRRCHNKNDALSHVVYNNPSFGKILALESLVPVMAYDEQFHIVQADGGYTDDERLFALFVRNYQNKFQTTLFHNPWSVMRRDLKKGQCTSWGEVCEYSTDHPGTRTALIKAEIEQLAKPIVHQLL